MRAFFKYFRRVLRPKLDIAFVFVAMATSAFAGPLPELATPEDRLKFLLFVRKELPQLFTDAAKYDIDLMKILEDQEKLQDLLRKLPQYEAKIESKLKSLKSIEIRMKAAASETVTQVSAEALQAWRSEIVEGVERELASGRKYTMTEFNALAGKVFTDARRTPASLIGGLMASLPADGKTRLGPLLKNKPLHEVLAVLEAELPGELPASFKFAAQGFEAMPSKADLITEIARRAGKAESALAFFQAWLVISRAELGEAAIDSASLRAALAAADESTLLLHADRDFVGPRAKFLVDLIESEHGIKTGLDAKRDLAEPTQKLAGTAAEKRVTRTQKSSSHVMLKEVEPGIAIFRGCSGGDCSSQYSFPYPNDPNERVFFVYDESDRLKGYVSATEVKANGKKSLYVITVSGNRVNELDAKLVLNGLYLSRAELGVDQIVLPAKDRIKELLNFPPIRTAYEGYLKKSPVAKIDYQGDGVRAKIEGFGSTYNKGHYDHASRNSAGAVFEGDSALVASLEAKTAITKPGTRLTRIEPSEVVEFALDMMYSRRVEQAEQAVRVAGMDWKEFENLHEALQNKKSRSVEEWRKALRARLEPMGATGLLSKEHLLYPGLMRAPDAFSAAYRDETVAKVLADLKSLEGASSPRAGWDVLKRNRAALFADARLERFARELFAGLAPDAKPATLTKSVNVLSRIAPSDWGFNDKLGSFFHELYEGTRLQLLAAMARIGVPPPELWWLFVQQLKSPDELVRLAAADLIGKFEHGKVPFDDLIESIDEYRDAAVRAKIMDTAAWHYGGGKEMRPSTQLKLAGLAFDDPLERVRVAAARALKALGANVAPEVYPKLVEALGAKKLVPETATVAIELLGKHGNPGDDVHLKVLSILMKKPLQSREVENAIAAYVMSRKPKGKVYSEFFVKLIEAEETGFIREEVLRMIDALQVVDDDLAEIVLKRAATASPASRPMHLYTYGKVSRGRIIRVGELDLYFGPGVEVGVRSAAANAKTQMLLGHDSELIAHLAVLEAKKEWADLSAALGVLVENPPKDRAILEQVAKSVGNSNRVTVSERAARVLANAGVKDPVLVKAVREAIFGLADSDMPSPAKLMEELARLHDLSGDLELQRLYARIAAENPQVYSQNVAAGFLRSSGARDQKVTAILAKALSDPGLPKPATHDILELFKTHGELPGPAQAAALGMLKRGKDAQIRQLAAEALIAAKSREPAIIEMLKSLAVSGTGEERSLSVRILSATGAQACVDGLPARLGAILE